MIYMIEGMNAKAICEEILASPEYSAHPGAKGLWKENGKWVAFDNISCDCWMEDFHQGRKLLNGSGTEHCERM